VELAQPMQAALLLLLFDFFDGELHDYAMQI
jgi:hypothetical protein